MIVASHQPNFMPYMGFFYKMYMCDVFTLSDTVKYSSSGYQNFNYIDCRGTRTKITVPVTNKGGAILDVQLADWEHNRRKLWETIKQNYSKAPHYTAMQPVFRELFEEDNLTLAQLNTKLIERIHGLLGLDCALVNESDLGITGNTPTEQIADICAKTQCETYLSGLGAKAYLDEEQLKSKGYSVLWSAYEPLHADLSVLDYLMRVGCVIPREWEVQKEALRRGGI